MLFYNLTQEVALVQKWPCTEDNPRELVPEPDTSSYLQLSHMCFHCCAVPAQEKQLVGWWKHPWPRQLRSAPSPVHDSEDQHPQKQAHWPHAHVSFVFLPINDAQQGGSLLVLKVKSHVIHGFYWENKEDELINKQTRMASVLRCERAQVRAYLCPSDSAAWWWILWSGAAGGIWAGAGLCSLRPACWSDASSPWSECLRNTAGTAEAKGECYTPGPITNVRGDLTSVICQTKSLGINEPSR